MTDLKHKLGFTLAEMLISLAIIGIVAILTIPTMIQKYKEMQYVTQLKKSYSVLQNAFQMAIAEHGTIDQWGLNKTVIGEDEEGNQLLDNSSVNLIFEYISPYLKIASYKNEYPTSKFKNYSLDGRERVSTPSLSTNELHKSATLMDGTFFSIGWVSAPKCNGYLGQCADFWVYLPDKRRQLGVTLFNFMITANGLLPQGTKENISGTSFQKYCDIKNKIGAPSDNQGRGCTAWVIYEGNMEYLRCDDLSWTGKKKCSD